MIASNGTGSTSDLLTNSLTLLRNASAFRNPLIACTKAPKVDATQNYCLRTASSFVACHSAFPKLTTLDAFAQVCE